MKVTIILTCFNRKEKTINCIKKLLNNNEKRLKLSFVVVDDNSSDGTYEELKKINCNLILLRGDGNLFWAGGMRKGIKYCLDNRNGENYYLLVNDDVDFMEDIIPKLTKFAEKYCDCVVVGATCDRFGKQTYGMQRRVMSIFSARCDEIPALGNIVEGDTFNANCVLIPSDIFCDVGNFDSKYHHSLADWDYGFAISKRGYKIINYNKYVGYCEKNSCKNTWKDPSLSRIERLKKKESIKGAPFKEWFYYLKKNYNIFIALRYSISPYIRILMRK